MTLPTGGKAWIELGGLSVPKLTLTSRDCGEMTEYQEMKELGASKTDGAAQLVNQVMSIRLQTVQMQTGCLHWMGE